MFWLLVSFTLILQISITTASFHCVECAQAFTLNPVQRIDIDRLGCALKNESSDMCMAALQMDYENNNASVVFHGLAQDLSNISNRTTMITHSMQISLDTQKMKRSIQVYCSQNGSCVNFVNEIYLKTDPQGIIQLQKRFQSCLFNSTNSADLLCENNQNEIIPCPNGLCQLIHNGESGFTRNCIPEGFSAFAPSILIASSLVEQFENKSSFMYFCNQPLCNNLTIAEKVQQSLAQYGLLTPFNDQPIYQLQTTTKKSNGIMVRMVPQTIIGLLMIMMIFV